MRDTTRKRVVKPAEDRRRELMDAAVKVFAKKGLPGASVAEICDAAGVAKGTFYVYFESKEHLLGALKTRHADELLNITAAHLELRLDLARAVPLAQRRHRETAGLGRLRECDPCQRRSIHFGARLLVDHGIDHGLSRVCLGLDRGLSGVCLGLDRGLRPGRPTSGPGRSLL